MIHVCYALYDKDGRYSKFTATSMLSIFENVSTAPPSVTVHILHDNTLSLENRDKFNQIAGRYGQIVKFYNVEKLCQNRIIEIKNFFASRLEKTFFSIATFYRFFVDEVLDSEIEKIIYLDSDIVVNLDIAEFWRIDLGDKPLAAITECENGVLQKNVPLLVGTNVRYENYFNAGVLLQNLKIMRTARNKIAQGIKLIAENPQYLYFDQDILNYCFSAEYLHLPLKFNQTVRHARAIGEKLIHKKIYHYNNHALKLNFDDVFNKLWFRYFEKTPFFTAEVIGRLYGGIRELHIQGKKFAVDASAIVSGKMRAFFIPPQAVEWGRQVFRIKPNEEIIPAISADSLRLMVDSIRNSGGRKIFFILLDNFSQVYDFLTRAGLVFGRDFISGFEFLSEAEGLAWDSYSFIKLL